MSATETFGARVVVPRPPRRLHGRSFARNLSFWHVTEEPGDTTMVSPLRRLRGKCARVGKAAQPTKGEGRRSTGLASATLRILQATAFAVAAAQGSGKRGRRCQSSSNGVLAPSGFASGARCPIRHG